MAAEDSVHGQLTLRQKHYDGEKKLLNSSTPETVQGNSTSEEEVKDPYRTQGHTSRDPPRQPRVFCTNPLGGTQACSDGLTCTQVKPGGGGWALGL